MILTYILYCTISKLLQIIDQIFAFNGRLYLAPPIIFARIVRSKMPYNFVADSFHTKKLCSRLSSSEVRFYTEIGRFAFWVPLWGDDGQRTMFILGHWKARRGFPISVNWTFCGRCYGWAAASEKRYRKSSISLQRGQFDPKFQVERVTPPHTNHSSSQITVLNDLSYGITRNSSADEIANVNFLRRRRIRITYYDILKELWLDLSTYINTSISCPSRMLRYRIRWNYAVQGHPRSPILVPIESSYTTCYCWLIVTYLLSCTVSKLWSKFRWREGSASL